MFAEWLQLQEAESVLTSVPRSALRRGTSLIYQKVLKPSGHTFRNLKIVRKLFSTESWTTEDTKELIAAIADVGIKLPVFLAYTGWLPMPFPKPWGWVTAPAVMRSLSKNKDQLNPVDKFHRQLAPRPFVQTESSLNDLYLSAVKAFPATTKRQHATDPVIVEELRWIPFVGTKTLYIRGSIRNEDHHYHASILFKGVKYDSNEVQLTASDGKEYSLEKLSLENTDVLVRCSCPDFRWRFAWYDHLDKSLYGRHPAPYTAKGVRPPANPLELEGMCKHLIKMSKVLQEAGIFSD